MSTPLESLLLEVLEASETGYWSFDLSTGEAYLSDGILGMLGYPAGAFPKSIDGVVSLLHPEDKDAFLSWFARSTAFEAGPVQGEFRFRTANAGWKWLQVKGKVVERGADGSAKRVLGTHMDVTQRRLVEKAWGETEALWTSLVDQVPLGITLLDRDGQILFVNRFEAEQHEALLVGRNWKDFMPEELHLEANWVLEQGFAGSRSVVFETYRTRKDGTVVRFENHVSSVRREGDVKTLLIVSMDKTAQHQTRRRQAMATRRMEVLLALHNEREITRTQVLSRTVDSALAVTGSSFGCLFLLSDDQSLFSIHSFLDSQTGRGLPVGSPDHFAVGKTGAMGAAVHQRAPAVDNDVIGSSSLPLGKFQAPVTLRRFVAVPILEKEKVVAVLGVGNKVLAYDEDDISELLTLTESLWQLQRRLMVEETSNLLHRAVEESPVSLVIASPDGAIEYANPKYYQFTDRKDSKSGALPPFFRNGLESGLREEIFRTLLEGKAWTGEWSRTGNDGQRYSEWATVSPVKDRDGSMNHVIAVLEDTTEQKAAFDMLANAQKMETVGQLAAGVAHDFNNLLTSVLAFNEMLLRKLEVSNPLRLYAERIEKSGRRAADLVSGLLAIGRQQRLSKALVDLRELIRQEEELLVSLGNGLLRFIPPESEEPLPVEIDSSQISQVIVNLVSNARDALGAKGTQIILSWGLRTDDQGKWGWLAVEDDGPGIPPEIVDKVFDPFFTTKPIGKGTGLGLSIVQGIVHQHQGNIDLRSIPGKGTRFLISLPYVATSQPVPHL